MQIWKFHAKAFGRKKSFYINESVPFLGSINAAQKEAQKRKEKWELANADFICQLVCEPAKRSRKWQ